MSKYKIYYKIANVGPISRRYFVNNFYDGMLTILGILLGFFVVILKGGQPSIESNFIIYTGMGTSISMFISGFSGSYLSERAEQKKLHVNINRAMGKYEEDENGLSNPIDQDVEEIQKAMLIPIKKRKKLSIKKKRSEDEKEEIKTLYEKAEDFAGKVVSLVNGGAPFFGGLVPLIPFFLVSEATFITFIISFFIIILCIVLLGIFLGLISETSILKTTIQMISAFTITIIISIVFLG